MFPLFQHIGAIGGEASLEGPGARFNDLSVTVTEALGTLNSSFLHRIVAGEGTEVEEVCAGAIQDDRQGLSIFRGFDVQFVCSGIRFFFCKGRLGFFAFFGLRLLRHFRIAVDDVKHVGIVGCGHPVDAALPAVLKVRSGQRAAIGPFKIVSEGKGVGQTIFTDIDFFGQVILQLTFGIVGPEAGKTVDSQAGAIDRGVQGRIETVRFTRDIKANGIFVAIVREHEKFKTEKVAVKALKVGFCHVRVIVIIQWADTTAIHQHVFRLMHKSFTLNKVFFTFD